MRLINTLFIICLFGKLINCNNNNNDQTKSNDNLVQSASNQQQTVQTGPESRQMSHGGGGYHDSNSNNINIYTNELSPKQSAYHNSHPGAPIGYIKIQPMLASPFASSHQPEEQGSTTFLKFIKPEKHSRRSSLTNKLKSFMSSLLSWKDSPNSNTPYMTSGSSYSYSALHPPFNFQPSSQQLSPNYAASANLASASSQYKPIVFPNNYQSNSNGYKYSNTFNPTHLNGNNQQSNNQQSNNQQSSPQYFYNQASASNQLNNYAPNSNSLNNLNNPSQFTTFQNRNQNNLNSNSNLNHNNFNNFPANSFQVASSNVNSVYTSSSNQYQPSSNQNNQPELNNNQRSETVDSLNEFSSSSSSSGNPGNSPLTNNPVL